MLSKLLCSQVKIEFKMFVFAPFFLPTVLNIDICNYNICNYNMCNYNMCNYGVFYRPQVVCLPLSAKIFPSFSITFMIAVMHYSAPKNIRRICEEFVLPSVAH